MKNCLAFFGFLSLLLVLALGVVLLFVSIDLSGLAAERLLINGTPVSPGDLEALETLVSGGVEIERSNPSEEQPFPTSIPTAVPTPTAVPRLEPEVYRSEVMIQARSFASALEAFLDTNDELGENVDILEDPAWREQARAAVEQVATSGRYLAEIGPPPTEYEAIDAWLNRVGPEAEGLRDNYLQGLETGGREYFAAASENLARIREYLYRALEEMARAGWPVE